jgi:hypothetical protein
VHGEHGRDGRRRDGGHGQHGRSGGRHASCPRRYARCAVGTALWRARSARTTPALGLALLIVAASAGLYTSIYLTVSETGYWIALAVLILASILSTWAERRRAMARTA